MDESDFPARPNVAPLRPTDLVVNDDISRATMVDCSDADEIWVFGYGSLMWNPGFEPCERALAQVHGFARSFCMWSIHHRGTPEMPGLVLALDTAHPQAVVPACHGMAFRVGAEKIASVLADLRARELVSAAYREETVPMILADGRRITGLTYVIERDHPQYCGHLSLEEQALIISTARGGRGPNAEYLANTVGLLTQLGIADDDLTWLHARVQALGGFSA